MHGHNVDAAWAVWQSLCVAGEAHAEAITKVGLFSTEEGTFMVQFGQSDTDLRHQFGGDPQNDHSLRSWLWNHDRDLAITIGCQETLTSTFLATLERWRSAISSFADATTSLAMAR